MPKNHGSRIIAAAGLVASVAALAVHGCREQPTEPVQARAAAARHHLILQADGSTASGALTSQTGRLTCTFGYASSQLTTSGTCESDFISGSVVVISATPPANGGTVAWTHCDRAHTDDPLSCRVTMSSDRTIIATFAPPPSSYLLTVQGGAGGSGTVESSPSGISCRITSGSTPSVCSARFPSSSIVTLRASAPRGRPIKAWAGGHCEKRGTGIGSTLGSCAVTMSQTQNILVSFEASTSEAAAGQWSAPISWPHVAIHAHLLPNGLVMTWGRKRQGALPVLWNPATPGGFTTLSEPVDYFCSGHALLPDGRLIVTGGHSGTADVGLRTTYLFNFTTNHFAASKKMRNGRWYPTTTTLASGAVLTISGGDTAGVLNTIPEVWKQGSWRALTTAQRSVPYYPMMFVAPNGQVFMAGPEQQSMYLNTSGTGTWTTGPRSNFGDRSYGSAVMYDAGKILLVGGNETAPTNTAEVIDLNAGAAAAWRPVQPMSVARRQVNATLLADGKVLLTGGTNAPGFNSPPTDSKVLAAELWDPDTEAWSQLSSMSHQRLYHSTALLLPDGRVLSVGSGSPAATGLTDDFTAEIFSPPYLFNADGTPAVRPSIDSAPLKVSFGQAFTVGTPDAASITKVTWIRLSSVTHSTNMDQQLNRLTFSVASSSSLSITAPSNPNLAPPGYYLLFLVNAQGVPSVGKFIQIL
jgi:hypothetical protein